MSLNPDTLPPLPEDLNDFGAISPLCRDYNSFSRFSLPRSRPKSQFSELNSTETFAESLSLRLSRANLSRNSFTKEPESSTLFPSKAKFPNVKNRRGYSPIVVEPESSSSQPNEPSSGTRQTQSPYFSQFKSPQKQDSMTFSDEFYRRVNDYLDMEGLDFMEPADVMQGFHQVIFSRTSKNDSSYEEETQVEVKVIKSANQSPRLVSEQLFTSTLFQRRASRSQGPGKELGIQKPVLGQPQPEKLRGFKHFKDDINNLLQVTSPIEESFTPALSRNESEIQEKDLSPDNRIGGLQRFSFRQLMSPSQDSDSLEDPRSTLMKYTMNKHPRSFKSPHMEVSRLGSFNNLTSPVHKMKEARTPASLRSSPHHDEIKAMRNSVQLNGTPRRHGAVIKKSQFKKLYALEEAVPLN